MEKIRIGLIGCGAIFPLHAYSLRAVKGVEIVAICDIKEDLAKKRAEEFNCEYFTDYKEMITSGKVDCVHIMTPHYLHCEMTVFALEHGINVVCEKPMGIHPDEGDKMMAAAEKSGARLCVIFQNRHNSSSLLAKNEIKSGRLGKVLGGKVIVTWDRSEAYYAQAEWRGTLDQEGGGVIINQAIHSMDLARWLVDDEIEKIEGTAQNYCHPSIEVEDEATGIVTFKNGVRINYYTTNNMSYSDMVEVFINCEKGIIRIKGDKAVIDYFDGTPSKESEPTKVDVSFGENAKAVWGFGHYLQLSAFYNALINDLPDDSAAEGLKTHKMIMELYRVSRQ